MLGQFHASKVDWKRGWAMTTTESEHALAQLVRQSIHAKHRELIGITVDVTGPDTVHLSGQVASYYLRQVAVSIAQQVPGVRYVSDGILVTISRHRPRTIRRWHR